MLSNTAVPKYYGEFRDKVIRGEIPVNEEISMEMCRIDELIRNPGVYYDDKAIDGYIAFCENELTLTDGSDLVLLDTFKLWAEQLLSWFYFLEYKTYDPKKKKLVVRRKKKRLINKQYLEVGRSNAKSLYLSTIQSYFLVVDKTTTYQVTSAPTVRQADEVLSPIKTAITLSRGPVFKFMTYGSLQNTTGSKKDRIKLAATKKGIENFMTNSIIEIRPFRIDKLQGLRSKVNTVDEWLSCDTRENIINALEQGAAKIDDYVIIASSSEGTVRNSTGDSIKMELMDVLKGKYRDIHTSIFIYKLDNVKEVSDPEMWIKANPNIGVTVDYETLEREVEKAEHVPSARNDILAKRFGIPTEGYTYFFTYEETFLHRRRTYWQMPCAMGADLSQGDDFCAFTFLFPLPDGRFGIKTRSYITKRTFDNLQPSARLKYNEFLDEGSLIIFEGSVLNMMDVYEDILVYIESNSYDVLAFGYDPYNAREFIERWARENGDYGIVKVPQGVKTESVPLGEIKILAEDRALLFDESLMSYAMGNCIVLEDTNGNRKLLKKRHDEKIDNVAALMDAYIAYKTCIEEFR